MPTIQELETLILELKGVGAPPSSAALPGEHPLWYARHRSDRDWTEDLGEENGWYLNLCGNENEGCCLSFIGRKGRFLCRSCAKPAEGGTPDSRSIAIKALRALKAAIRECDQTCPDCENETHERATKYHRAATLEALDFAWGEESP